MLVNTSPDVIILAELNAHQYLGQARCCDWLHRLAADTLLQMAVVLLESDKGPTSAHYPTSVFPRTSFFPLFLKEDSNMTTLRAPRHIDFAIFRVEDTDERTTHKASCHCGAIQYEVTLNYPFPKYPVHKCTCTICTHNGYLFVYPLRQDVIFTKGVLGFIVV